MISTLHAYVYAATVIKFAKHMLIFRSVNVWDGLAKEEDLMFFLCYYKQTAKIPICMKSPLTLSWKLISNIPSELNKMNYFISRLIADDVKT